MELFSPYFDLTVDRFPNISKVEDALEWRCYLWCRHGRLDVAAIWLSNVCRAFLEDGIAIGERE